MSSQQACLVLCLAALAVAAPQQDLGDLRSVEITRDGLDRERVVSQVVAALTPEIQTAVAQALAALQRQAPQGHNHQPLQIPTLSSGGKTTSGFGLSTSPAAGSSFGSGSSSSHGSGLPSNGGLGTSSIAGSGISSNGASGVSSNFGSGKSSNGAGSVASSSFGQAPTTSTTSALPSTQPGSQTSVPEGGASQSTIQANSELDTSLLNNAQSLTGQATGPTAKPVYNFEYKVSSEADQTYLSQSEERDGDQLTGSYRYVNPLGALITVNYQAGPMGFSQTIDQQEGFIAIRPNPLLSLTSVPSSPSLNAIVSAKSESDNSKSLLTGSKLSSNTQSGSSGSETTVNSSGSNASGSESIVPSSEREESESSSKAEPSSTVNQQELINTIISSLQPEITAAIKAALDKTKTDNQAVSRLADSKSKKTLQDASAVTLNSIEESGGKLNTILPKEKGEATETSKNLTPLTSGRSAGTIIPISTNSVGKPGVDRDLLSKFGSGLFVKIKTPDSEISY